MDESNIQYFDVINSDIQGSNQAGVEFSISENYYGSQPSTVQYVSSTATVDFELISFFQFDSSLVSNNQLAVQFKYDLNFDACERYVQSTVYYDGDPGTGQTSTTDSPNSFSFTSDILDLVAITNYQSGRDSIK
jgi:hypothetical protein